MQGRSSALAVGEGVLGFHQGLGAFGEAGVSKALQILHKELDVSMAFCGRTDIRTVDRSILVPGTYPAPTIAG